MIIMGGTIIPSPVWEEPAVGDKLVIRSSGYWSMETLRDAYYTTKIFDLYEAREVVVIDWLILRVIMGACA